MIPIKRILLTTCAAVTLAALAGFAATPKDKAPLQVGKTQYKDQVIPVFDSTTVLHNENARRQSWVELNRRVSRRVLLEGATAHVMVIIDESGAPLECGMMDASDKEFGAFALAEVRRWKYQPLLDKTGKPILHALKVRSV